MSDEKLFKQVQNIIDEKIKPLLKDHGGDISLKEVVNKKVKVRFLGACNGCPSMQTTLEDIVERILRDNLGDEIDEVILSNETNPELIELAKSILRREKTIGND